MFSLDFVAVTCCCCCCFCGGGHIRYYDLLLFNSIANRRKTTKINRFKNWTTYRMILVELRVRAQVLTHKLYNSISMRGCVSARLCFGTVKCNK